MDRTAFRISFLVISFFKVSNSQPQSALAISQNFCALFGLDNFSCPEDPTESGLCLQINFLCDFSLDCIDGSDEGLSFFSLICDPKSELVRLLGKRELM